MVVGDYHIKVCVTGPWKENCYLLTHQPSREQALIDPGDDPEKIIEMVESEKGTLKYILATHAHVDHIAAVTSVCEQFDQSKYQYLISNYKNRSRENIELYLITKRIQSFADDIAIMIMKNTSEIEISEMFETTLQFIREQNIIYDLHKELESNHNVEKCPMCKNNLK